MYTENRETEIIFLKRLWNEVPTPCPKCGHEYLEHLHRKTKKSNNEWKCPACGEIFRTINMLMDLPDK